MAQQTNTSARFNKTKTPQSAPGCCFLCRGATDRWFVDTNMSVDWDGAVYICNFCLEEMAALAGYISPEQAEKLNEKIGRLEVDVFKLTKRENGLEVAIEGLVSAGHSNDNPLTLVGGSRPPAALRSTDSQERENDVGEGEGTTPESSHDEGVDELHTDDAANEPFELTL